MGGAVGDSSYNAQLAGVIGQNAVENNEFSIVIDAANKLAAKKMKKIGMNANQWELILILLHVVNIMIKN
ncbi:VENN motif pre-toxin domain-containing protein [Acinetobacter sp. SAAs470]|nr:MULTISPECIES: VENN motif pre-toxin domain-containing protein [unclassified Acinetobacter]WOE33051.1 VENN motif pre-toxin domain-containing protein [Acinetobacter sp. SAAs470]WOE39883.1 VENN motif pre-toxin domain-containing protein [Acinetobacter sp. SAAs474]